MKMLGYIYEVDAAMLGSEWSDADDLDEFCRCLQAEVSGVDVVAIHGSWNGASNAEDVRDLVSDSHWDAAVAAYTRAAAGG